MAAALQQTRISLWCHSSSQPHSKPTTKLFFSSNLRIPKLTIKSLRSARMADTNNTIDTIEQVLNFVLVDMKRIKLIEDIVRDLEVVYNKVTATELAIVTSVVQLESQHLAALAKGVQKLTGARRVRIKTVIDPSLLAGFTIRFGSKLVDMSVKKQLDEIASQW